MSSHPAQISVMNEKETIASMLSSLMEAVRITVACECVYVRAAVIKSMIWMLSPYESVDELKSIIAGELSDPVWPASLLNDILLTLHARFKVCRPPHRLSGGLFSPKLVNWDLWIWKFFRFFACEK